MDGKKIFAYVGTWSVQAKENGGGIGIYEYDEKEGSLRYIETIEKNMTAGMLCVDKKRGVLYGIDERRDSETFFGEGGGGRVLAFSIDPQTGALSQLGKEQPTYGLLPAYVALDGSRNWLVACNHSDRVTITKCVRDEDGEYHVVTEYSDVTAALYHLEADGSIGKAVQVVSFPADSGRPPKVGCLHCVKFAPDGEHLVLTDMKQDLVLLYRLDREKGRLVECSRLFCRGGNYPHYVDFHPDLPVFYLNNEHAHLLDVVRYDENWNMQIVQTIDVTPGLEWDMTGKKVMQTDVGVSADGKYVYDLYRGANSIWVFQTDEKTGLLTKKQEFKFGKEGNPRGCAISPDGRFMLVADNDGHQVITLAIDGGGTLKDAGKACHNLKFPGNISFYWAE